MVENFAEQDGLKEPQGVVDSTRKLLEHLLLESRQCLAANSAKHR